MDWTEKYRPSTLSEVIGNPTAVNSLRSWARSWEEGTPAVRAAVLMGSPGVGKTTSAEALAREMGWGIVEMNASDQRTAGEIERIAIGGALNDTFSDDGSFLRASSGGRKLIVLDEADNFFGNADRGASTAVAKLIRESSQPVILIVNDFYGLSRKIPSVKEKTIQITFKKPQAGTMAKALYRIAEAEGVEVEPAAMELIAENASGDMRAAVRNLESLAIGQDVVTLEMAEGLSSRDVRTDIFELMGAVFRSGDPEKARRIGFDIDEEPRNILSWIDENMPTECTDHGDLVRGYERLSRADIFLSRVMSRQYYGFWSYAKDMMTFGVCASKQSRSRPGSRMNFPGVARKISAGKKVREIRGIVCLKLAEHLHTTSRRVQNDVLPYVRAIVSNDAGIRVPLAEAMSLEPEELAFLMQKKADSKAVTSVLEQVEKAREARILGGLSKPPSESRGLVPETHPKAEKIPEKQEKQERPAPAATRKTNNSKAQKSLFDF